MRRPAAPASRPASEMVRAAGVEPALAGYGETDFKYKCFYCALRDANCARLVNRNLSQAQPRAEPPQPTLIGLVASRGQPQLPRHANNRIGAFGFKVGIRNVVQRNVGAQNGLVGFPSFFGEECLHHSLRLLE